MRVGRGGTSYLRGRGFPVRSSHRGGCSARESSGSLLDRLASQTGGRYWKPQDLSSLADEISFSEAGVTTRTTKDLWNMPAVFLLMLALRFGEWLLRRRWGVV